MKKDEKRIVVRVPTEKWQKLDDKRHEARVSFQVLGEQLLADWLAAGRYSENRLGKSDKESAIMHLSPNDAGELSEEESKWVKCLLAIIRSGNEVALRAVLSNLIAFSDYVRAVPEVPNGWADLAAKARRIAALDEQLMDAIEAASVGRRAVKPRAGRGPKKAVG